VPAQNEEKILDLDEEDITLSIPQTNKDLKKFTKVRAKNEFEQRKAAFIERMNSIATAGNKNVVYEGLEKKSENNRQYFDDQIRIDQVTQQVYKQFQPVGRAHHVAASKLQSSFRRYQTRQKRAATTSFGASSSSPAILEVDECLRSLMKHWTDKEIESLRDNFTMRCESIVDVKKKGHITRKQLSFIFSQISRFVLEPSIMRSLIDYFDQSRGEGAKIDYLALIDFVCSTPAEDFIQNNSILRRLDTLRINNSQLATLLSVADTQHNGLLSLGDFKHCLQQRMEIRLSTGDLRLLVVLFDLNGYEIMYRPLLHLLNQLPSCNTLTNVILRLQRLGTSRIREKIYIHIQSDDGLVSKEQLMQVLTINCEAILDHNETMVLLDVLDTKGSGKISVQEFIRLIESDQTDPSVNTKDTYDIKALQRLASNARKLMCPDHGMLVQAFERFDWKQRGIIPLQEFIHVVRQSGFLVLTTSQIETIAKKFGSKLQGTFGINYREFIEWTSAKQVEMKLVEQKLREFAIKQAEHKVSNEPKAGNFGMLEKVLTEWKKQFTQADVNHSGFITRRQFASVCTQKLNLPIDAEDLRVLLFGYDRQLNDQVDYGAFVQLNFDETAGASTASSKSVKFEEPGSPSKSSQISHELSGSLQKIKKIFKDTPEDLVLENIEKYHAKQRLQENSHGEYLTISSFLLSMKELGVKISSEEVQALFSHFGVKSQNDKDRNQVLDYKTFLVEQLGFSKNLVESYHRRKSSEIKQQESKEDRQRLDELLSSAASFSSSDYSKALHQLKKTAISKGFFEQRLVEKAKVWKTMALSGFEDMLSKKGLSLLIKQFAEEDGDNDEVVSLKLLYKYLRKFRSESPGKSSSPRTTMTLSPSKSPQRIRTTYHNMERIVKGTDTSVVETMRMLAAHWDKEGVDLRGFFEQYDPQYSGHISALHFKTILLQLGIQTFVADAAPEETIGLLVRRYLNNGLKDAIDYVTMLHQILPAYPHLSSDSAVDILEENVRSRFRLNAGFEGRIRMKGFSTYGQLDSAFARLDVEKKGFISIENLKQGLRSMGFNSSPAELNQLMKRMARYYKPEIQSLSRMEFDSFVLDPYGSRLLYKLAQFFFFDSRQEDSRFNVDSEIPRIARLSQVFISKDVNNIGMLPLSVATSSLEQVMAKHLTPVEVSTLQHLFDVQRKEAFAYKLFLKVMSHFGSLHAQNSSSMLTERSFPSKRKIWSNEMNHGGMEQEDNFDKLKKELNSLYAQLSKVDFESSVEIMEEYFRREDQTRKGSISQEQLLSLMNKVGVSISWDTCRVFQKFLGESNSSSDISYQRLLKTLRDLHEDRVSSTNRHGNREQTKRDNHSHNKTGSFLTDLKRQLEKEGINENSLTHAILSQKEKFTLTLPTFLRLLQSLGVKYSTENVVELRNRFSSCDSNASGQFIVNDEAFLQALFR
jgi:Ca2+-binding EF-hand superfamily protein